MFSHIIAKCSPFVFALLILNSVSTKNFEPREIFFTSKTILNIESITREDITFSLVPTTVTCALTGESVTTCGTRRNRQSPFIEVQKPTFYQKGDFKEDLIKPSKPVEQPEGSLEAVDSPQRYSLMPEKRQIDLNAVANLTDFDITVAQKSTIGTTLTLFPSQPRSTVTVTVTFDDCTPLGISLCQTSGLSTTISSTLTTTEFEITTESVTCAVDPVPTTVCSFRSGKKESFAIDKSPFRRITSVEKQQILPAKTGAKKFQVNVYSSEPSYQDVEEYKRWLFRQFVVNSGSVSTFVFFVTETLTLRSTRTEVQSILFDFCTPANVISCVRTVTSTETVTRTLFEGTVSSTQFFTCGITTAPVTECSLTTRRRKRDGSIIESDVKAAMDGVKIRPDKASKLETGKANFEVSWNQLRKRQDRQLDTVTTVITSTDFINGGTSTTIFSSTALVTYASCTPPEASICSSSTLISTVTSTVTQSVTVLEIATSTTNCGTTTAPVGLCMGRRRRRESPFIDAHEYRSKMTAETLSEPILPDKPKKGEFDEETAVEPSSDKIAASIYSRNWSLFKQFVEIITEFVTVASTITTTQTTITTVTFTYAGCTPPDATLCP